MIKILHKRRAFKYVSVSLNESGFNQRAHIRSYSTQLFLYLLTLKQETTKQKTQTKPNNYSRKKHHVISAPSSCLHPRWLLHSVMNEQSVFDREVCRGCMQTAGICVATDSHSAPVAIPRDWMGETRMWQWSGDSWHARQRGWENPWNVMLQTLPSEVAVMEYCTVRGLGSGSDGML